MDTALLAICIFVAALLYSSVGHAGASGYLAAMALFGLAPTVMRPAALVLNVMVASIGTYRFWRAGHLSWRLLWPFATLSIPFAFYGGRLHVDDRLFHVILGATLLVAAMNLLWQSLSRGKQTGSFIKPPPLVVALAVGGGIGLLAGLTGVGGGIFLSPVMLLMGWADPKKTAGVSVAFIGLNSVAGLGGQAYSGQFNPMQSLPLEFLMWGGAAIAGGLMGSWLGARRLSFFWLRALLALVLVIAGTKLLFG